MHQARDCLLKRIHFWRYLADRLDQGEPVVLLVVVETRGSTPRKIGAKMFVTGRGECFGTIGGGAFERGLVDRAIASMRQGNLERCLMRYEHDSDTAGMICGGKQTVLFFACRTEESASFRAAYEERRGVVLFSPQRVVFDAASVLSGPSCFTMQNEADWLFRENIGFAKRAYLIGGGHVSLALSKVLRMLDFEITVIDERDDLSTMADNQDADSQWIMPYSAIAEAIPEGPQVFVFIMTHSHRTDERIAASLAEKDFFYLGILGSEQKIARIRNRLRARLSDRVLQRIRGPIGLPIHSHTPEEIAVSIAAETIQLTHAE
ncbi:MAG: XdhC family protein [Methylomicrobium sp.]